MSNINKCNLRQGDVIHVPLMGLGRHYGVVVQPETPYQEAIIRTVLWKHSAPINQMLSEFSQGKTVSILPYQSQFSRWVVTQNALNVAFFKYNLVTNNCENFYRRAWGMSDVSHQALFAGFALVGCIAYLVAAKKPLSIKF